MFSDPEKIEFQAVDSSGRWPAVLSGRADFGIASTTILSRSRPARGVHRHAHIHGFPDSPYWCGKDAKIDSLQGAE